MPYGFRDKWTKYRLRLNTLVVSNASAGTDARGSPFYVAYSFFKKREDGWKAAVVFNDQVNPQASIFLDIYNSSHTSSHKAHPAFTKSA